MQNCTLLRGLLIHVTGLPGERRAMAELRRIAIASEEYLADILADMPALNREAMHAMLPTGFDQLITSFFESTQDAPEGGAKTRPNTDEVLAYA